MTAAADPTVRRRTIAACALLLLSAALACAAIVLPTSADPAGPAARPAAPSLPTLTSIPATPLVSAPLRPRPHPARPLALSIPAIHVDAPVVPLAAEGNTLTPPGDVSEVGWWAAGRRPGARRGHVLITGHTVHTGGGVFDHLGDLRHGDRMDVSTPRGLQSYRVIAVKYLSVKELADEAAYLFRLHDWPRLVLVTCAGWDGGGYNGNTVVIGRPIRPRTPTVTVSASPPPTSSPTLSPTSSPTPSSVGDLPTPQAPGWYFCPLCELQREEVGVSPG